MARLVLMYGSLAVALGSFVIAAVTYRHTRPHAPALVVDDSKYEFDRAVVGADLTATFWFTNTGRHLIRVLSIGTC